MCPVFMAEEAESAVRWYDADRFCLLGFEEFVKPMEGCGGKEERTPASLKRMLSRLGEKHSIEEDRKAMIRAFDLDGDGVLCFVEFRVMMR
ncbi:hypothetical protein MLD38_022135 [Melastoma candidum]|uniref:Uncharacterized protein n=1 Tax=Melastoma candidum TaxID=119954 RepID=A0ACB9QI76_9MYRT|nr:hypothetical protein MLD38_022135 [Melastoma candidum]